MRNESSPGIVVVGAGRSRNGLGPFLIQKFRQAGVSTRAVVGRNLERTEGVAAEVAAAQGEPVRAAVDLGKCLRDLRLAESQGEFDRPSALAVVIAAPASAHRAALEVACEAGVPVLCEKPLVDVDSEADTRAIGSILDRFAARELLLVENCQWPCTLPSFCALYPDYRLSTTAGISMRLSPTGSGRAMLGDSLSHLLSMLDALHPFDAGAALMTTRFEQRPQRLEFTAVARWGDGHRMRVRFELEQCEQQPRPAWYALDGHRVDRTIQMPEYVQELTTPDGRAQELPDPLEQFVAEFVAMWQAGDAPRRARHLAAIRHRERIYADIMAAYSRA